MSTKIQIRRGLAASWTSTNPVLSSGEIGFETDTYKLKIGNGSSTWTQLSYFADVLSASSSLVSYVDQRVSSVIDGAPDLLNTLNELAAALGDNPDVLSTFITSSTASSIYLTQASFSSASPNFATDAELASAIVTASAAAVAYADGLTTTDIAEGTNLYFTNERAVNAGSATYITPNSTSTLTNKTININNNTFKDGGVGSANASIQLFGLEEVVRIVVDTGTATGNISSLSIGDSITLSNFATGPGEININTTWVISTVGTTMGGQTFYTSNALQSYLSSLDGMTKATYWSAGGTISSSNEVTVELLTTQSASTIYATISSPTFTGTVTIPTLDLTNALPIADGGTGATTASAAFNALAPSQASNSGKYLTTNGTTTSWATVEGGGGGTASDDTIFKAQLFFGGSN